MTLPFTVDEFLAVFVRYNTAVRPLQVIAYGLGVVAVALVLWPRRYPARFISGILAAFWLITGLGYHFGFFRDINPIATLFGALFLVQAAIFIGVGVVRSDLSFALDRTPRSLIGGVVVLYAMVLYPLLGLAFGHVYPAVPAFGVAPCPVTTFTFGMLLWSDTRTPKWVIGVPLIWSALGLSAATTLGMREDFGMVVAAVAAVVIVLPRNSEEQPLSHPRGLPA